MKEVDTQCPLWNCNNPVSAMKNFKARVYDLLMIDIKMPVMNGLELYKEIKKKDNEIKVCFLTAGDK
jgi:YesN/AraC family two-component response regulator